MKIAFIGGCIIKQESIDFENLFYNIVKEDLYNKYKKKIIIITKQYWHYNTFYNISKNLIEEEKVEYLIIYLRAYPILGLIKPIIKYKKIDNSTSYFLHPKLTSLEQYYQKIYTPEVFQNDKTYLHLEKYLKKVYNLINFNIGKFFNLEEWFINFIMNEISRIEMLSKIHNTKIILAGPPGYPNITNLDSTCLLLNKKIHERYPNFSETNSLVKFIDIYNYTKNPIFSNDGIHINNKGHKEFANKITELIINNE